MERRRILYFGDQNSAEEDKDEDKDQNQGEDNEASKKRGKTAFQL